MYHHIASHRQTNMFSLRRGLFVLRIVAVITAPFCAFPFFSQQYAIYFPMLGWSHKNFQVLYHHV